MKKGRLKAIEGRGQSKEIDVHSPPATEFGRESSHPTLDRRDFSLRLRQGALQAVQQLNVQFLELLCERAASSSVNFPLPSATRERLAALASARRALIGSCGVLLVDIGFSRADRWQNALEDVPEAAREAYSRWAPQEQITALAHSILLVGWYLVHANPGIASVLLDMSPRPMAVYGELGLNDIAQIARRHPYWVRPRWEDNAEAWSSLLDRERYDRVQVSGHTTLRALQLCGGQVEWIVNYSAR